MENSKESEVFRQGIYRHFKGKYYRAFFTAQHSETDERFVVYQRLYGDFGYSIRPFDMFVEDVELDGGKVRRFEFVRDDL